MPVNLEERPLPDELPVIPDGWRYGSLGDLVEERGLSYGIVQPGSETTDGVPIVRVNNIRNGRIDTTDMLKVGADVEAKDVNLWGCHIGQSGRMVASQWRS